MTHCRFAGSWVVPWYYRKQRTKRDARLPVSVPASLFHSGIAVRTINIPYRTLRQALESYSCTGISNVDGEVEREE